MGQHGLVYIEFRARHPGTAVRDYRAHFGRTSGRVSGEHVAEDRLILNLARTWRLGPEPEYLMVYHTAGYGLERFASWTDMWRSDDPHLRTTDAQNQLAGRAVAAGCYDALVEPTAGTGGPYYGEYFSPVKGATPDVISQFFGERAAENRTLHLLAIRIGKLGPDPAGLAIWSIESYADLDTIARELTFTSSPIALNQVGVYEDLGLEII